MFKGSVSEETFEKAKSLVQEASIRIVGTVRAEERAASGVEVDVAELEDLPDSFGAISYHTKRARSRVLDGEP